MRLVLLRKVSVALFRQLNSKEAVMETKAKAKKIKAPKLTGTERYEQLKKEGRCVSCGKEKAYPGRVDGRISVRATLNETILQ